MFADTLVAAAARKKLLWTNRRPKQGRASVGARHDLLPPTIRLSAGYRRATELIGASRYTFPISIAVCSRGRASVDILVFRSAFDCLPSTVGLCLSHRRAAVLIGPNLDTRRFASNRNLTEYGGHKNEHIAHSQQRQQSTCHQLELNFITLFVVVGRQSRLQQLRLSIHFSRLLARSIAEINLKLIEAI